MLAKASSFLSSVFQVGGTPSLVLSLDAGNVLSYPGTGVTWSDLTIFNNDTFFAINNPTYSTSGGGSFQFGDVDDFFILSASASGFPLGDSQYTMEAWFNPDNLSQSTSLVLYGTLGTNTANVMGISNNNIVIDWSNNVLSSPTQSMIPGNWYYIASTYDGTDRKIYLNGSLIASDTPGVTNSVEFGDYFTIGYFMGQSFTGKISIVKLHTKALSGSRLLSNFNSLKTRFGYTFGSMTFDGTQSSYLISSSPDYAFGTNDFTIESFFRAGTSSSDSYSGIVSLRPNGESNSGVGINIRLYNTPNPQVEFFADGEFGTYSITNDVWYHAAISRNSGTSSFFINGELIKQITDTYNYDCNDLVIGRYFTNVDDFYLNGDISNVRVINGVGIYGPDEFGTLDFTIPDVQLVATASTKFLITSQQTNPTADVSGLLQSLTASNIGWTSSLPQFIVREGLEFFVDATDDVSNPSNSSSTWIDISGNGRNLTFSGPFFSPFCHPGCANSLLFQSNQTAQTSPVTISYPNGYTIESVVRFTNTSDGDGIFEFDESSSGKFINVQRESNGTIRFEVNQGNQLLSASTTTNNLWYHITCVYNSSTQLAKIYINGVEDASGTYASTTSTTGSIILGLHDTYLDGSISLTRFYSIPFTPSQVLINFNYTKSVYGL
jgi:hypothetical protein